MSETRPRGAGLSRRDMLKLTGAAAAGLLLTSCTGKPPEVSSSQETTIVPAPDHEAIHSPEVEAESLEAAGVLAASYQEALNLDGIARGVSVLGGTVRQAASDSEPAYEFKYPILLSTSGEFNDGSVLGTLANDEEGNVVLNTVIYNTDRHTFTQDAPDVAVLKDLDVRAVYTSVGEADEHLELIAFQPRGGSQVTGLDGAPIVPGMAFPVQ